MDRLNMFLGERRKAVLTLTNPSGTVFVIENASFSLLRYGVEEAKGSCIAAEHTVTVYIEPKQKGDYVLGVQLLIADEIVKKRLNITVS